MFLLTVHLLGQPKLAIDTYPCKFGVHKAEAMLYYSLFSPRPVSILYLCDLLWPDTEDRKARQNLNDAFYSLRKGLQEAHAPEAIFNCLSRSRGLVEFNRNCGYTCDAETFEGIISSATDKTDLQTLETALHLYRGPFLENFAIQEAPGFDAWVEGKRQALAGAYRKLLHLLSTRYLTQSNWPDAIKCLERLGDELAEAHPEVQRAISDPEVVHGLLMMCHAFTYRLDLAGQVYETYEQMQQADPAPSSPSPTLEKLHKIIQTYQPSNVRVRTLVADALRRISHRTTEPRLQDALMSVYMATGAQRPPTQGVRYREVLLRAQEEAVCHGATLIGTPHLVLALCDLTDETYSTIRDSLPLALERVAQALRTIVGEVTTNDPAPTEYTLSLQRVLQMAADVAGTVRANTIDIPHLWIAGITQPVANPVWG